MVIRNIIRFLKNACGGSHVICWVPVLFVTKSVRPRACSSAFVRPTWLYDTSLTITINPFPNKPWFLRVCITGLLKTLREKEKLLVTSNFSSSHSVFLPVWKTFYHFHYIWNCRLQTLSIWTIRNNVVWERVKDQNKLTRISINPFPNKPWFLCVCSTSLLKTLWEKEKLLVTSIFSFSHRVFYVLGELSAIFIKLEFIVCLLFQFGRVQNLSFGKGFSI